MDISTLIPITQNIGTDLTAHTQATVSADSNVVLVDLGALMMPIKDIALLYLVLNSHCTDIPNDVSEGSDHRFGF